MTEAQTASSSTVTRRSKRSSLVAKCKAPFSAKQRSFIEQEIRLDEPFRLYVPGDSVKGAVHLIFGKPTRITHLVVCLRGFVKVLNNELPGEKTIYDKPHLSSSSGGGKRGLEYFGDGLACLFQDETVLCGEGRVSGQYEFRFELILPSKNVPSSIDFERGTISYLVASTVTRPTAIAPTSIQHTKVKVQEAIDIAPIDRPKPVVVSLETSHKNGKPKLSGNKKVVSARSDRTSKCSSRDSTNGMPPFNRATSRNNEEPPSRPVSSDVSSITATASSNSSNPACLGDSLPSIVGNPTEDSLATSDPHGISVKTELLQGGCLAGDRLPMRISIKHNKAIKSTPGKGIIVTLYRQGCIDTHPAIPVGPGHKGEKRRFEDYYPKSRTGLGGLSLSSAGSSRSFRQDLAQIMMPIIIDPHSLNAVINTSIEVPAQVFPTITGVPGKMVSFRYFVEIVIDLRGKLSGQDRIRPHLSITSGPEYGYSDPTISRREDVDGVNYHSAPASSFRITDGLRRTKGIISTKSEITIGTRDSARKRIKQFEERLRQLADKSNEAELGREEEVGILNSSAEHRLHTSGEQAINGNNVPQTADMPLPEPEEELDEKTRLRRAEERLLPSAPPSDDHHHPLATTSMPSAPPAIDEEDFVQRYGLGAPAPAYEGPSAGFAESSRPRRTPQDGANPEDDKQELERSRLLALASSPDGEGDNSEVLKDGSQATAPSAPVLYEDDIFSINDPRIPESSPADFADDRIRGTNDENESNNVDELPCNVTSQRNETDDENLLGTTTSPSERNVEDKLPIYER